MNLSQVAAAPAVLVALIFYAVYAPFEFVYNKIREMQRGKAS